MQIRNAIETDYPAILAITKAAFADHPFSNQTEGAIIEKLHREDALTVSLVAEKDGVILGHVAFSAVAISDNSPDWYGLGPASVSPEFQKQGIGKALINKGLETLRALQARGCVVLGDVPYYQKFGFKNMPSLILEGVPQEHFMAISFDTVISKGTVSYHPAFFE